MANPNIAQGTLNRLRGSVVIPNFTNLNVTAPFLGRGGISIAFEGESTLLVPTMVGTVTSPSPYQMASISINLIKSQALAQAWETQRQTLSTIGDVTVITDASTLAAYTIINSAIETVAGLNFSGEDASYIVTVRGYYPVNGDLWNLI